MFSIIKGRREGSWEVARSGCKSARDMNTMAFHIEKSKGESLCGTNRAMYGSTNILPENVVASVNQQHDGWYCCAKCAAEFTGKPESFFTDARK